MSHIIVVGCGRLGAELAYTLFQQKTQVVVIDENDNAFNNLHPDFLGRRVHGDALNQGVLERAGIKQAHGLAAVTNSDPQNAVVAYLAQNIYRVPRVISRNYNPQLRKIHEIFGLQLISSTSWGAQRIEEILLHTDLQTDLRLIFSAGNGEVEIYEFIIPDKLNGIMLEVLFAGAICYPVALTRFGKAIIPDNKTILQTGDMIQVSATLDGARILRQRLQGYEV
jgi:trk system potassium uptake protein TrkA